MLKMKYKVISAAMVIAPLFLSTGLATTVQACPNKAPVGIHKVVRKAAPKPIRNLTPRSINNSKHKVVPRIGHKAAPNPINQAQHR